jgi:hypothetical protein
MKLTGHNSKGAVVFWLLIAITSGQVISVNRILTV